MIVNCPLRWLKAFWVQKHIHGCSSHDLPGQISTARKRTEPSVQHPSGTGVAREGGFVMPCWAKLLCISDSLRQNMSELERNPWISNPSSCYKHEENEMHPAHPPPNAAPRWEQPNSWTTVTCSSSAWTPCKSPPPAVKSSCITNDLASMRTLKATPGAEALPACFLQQCKSCPLVPSLPWSPASVSFNADATSPPPLLPEWLTWDLTFPRLLASHPKVRHRLSTFPKGLCTPLGEKGLRGGRGRVSSPCPLRATLQACTPPTSGRPWEPVGLAEAPVERWGSFTPTKGANNSWLT